MSLVRFGLALFLNRVALNVDTGWPCVLLAFIPCFW